MANIDYKSTNQRAVAEDKKMPFPYMGNGIGTPK